MVSDKIISVNEMPENEPKTTLFQGMHKSIWLALASAFLYALATPSSKLMLKHINPIMFAGLVYLSAGMGLTCFSWLDDRLKGNSSSGMFVLHRNDWRWFVGVVSAGGIVAPLCLMLAMNTARASSISLLFNLEILFAVVIARVVFKEAVSRRALLGLLAIVSGGVCLSWNADMFMSWSALLLMSIACLCWAIDSNFTCQMKNSEAIQIARLRGLIAGAFNLTLAFVMGQHAPALSSIGCAAAIGVVSYGLGLALYISALHQLGTAKTTAFFSTEPFLGALLALIVLREPFTINLALAALFMGVGVWLHVSEPHEDAQPYTPLS
jgi:drug/metabolite transporter (DMT)-like permease